MRLRGCCLGSVAGGVAVQECRGGRTVVRLLADANGRFTPCAWGRRPGAPLSFPRFRFGALLTHLVAREEACVLDPLDPNRHGAAGVPRRVLAKTADGQSWGAAERGVF